MGVTIPAYHLKSQADLPEMRRRLKGIGRRREIHRDLTLTSLIDVFSVVILFLIQSFSTTGEVLLNNPGLTLPIAYNGRTLMRAPIVTITPTGVTLEGAPVGDNSNIEEKVEDTSWDLPQMTLRLASYRQFVQSIYPGAPFSGEIIVQADASLNFIYLKRVMYTLTKAGFTAINMAVRGEAQLPKPLPVE